MDDDFFLNKALEVAQAALPLEEVPVGCVVVRNNEIICSFHNMTNANNNPLAHAEFLCTEKLVEMGDSLKNLTYYITIEPCAMCHGVLERVGANVVFGYYNEIFGANKILKKFSGKCLNNEKCIEILKKFYETPNKNTENLKSFKPNC